MATNPKLTGLEERACIGGKRPIQRDNSTIIIPIPILILILILSIPDTNLNLPSTSLQLHLLLPISSSSPSLFFCFSPFYYAVDLPSALWSGMHIDSTATRTLLPYTNKHSPVSIRNSIPWLYII